MFLGQMEAADMARTQSDRIRSEGHRQKPQKVLFLIDHLHMGGAERMLAAVAPRVASRGMSVRVCVLDRDPNPVMADVLTAAGVPVDRVPFGRIVDPLRWRQLHKYLGAQRPDVVHTQLEIANVAGLTLSKRLGLPTVSTLHTIEPRQALGRSELRRRLERRVLARCADQVVCVSQALLDFCREEHGMSARQLRLLYNGIDIGTFRPLPEEARNRVRRSLGVAPDAPMFITVAVLRQPKGIEFMIRAFASLCRRDPDARYLVVGSGDDRERLEALAGDLGVSSQVIFAGMRDDIPELVAASDIFVLPTLTEALPTVLAEAAAIGKPIVASAVGGVPEMIEDGETGLLVPPANCEALAAACGRLLANPALRQRMGQAARGLAMDRFDLELHADRLCGLYNRLAAQSEKQTCA